MIVNKEKTEAVYFSRKKQLEVAISCGIEAIKTSRKIKVLGIVMDEKLSWDYQVLHVISKMNPLSSRLKFLRKRLSRNLVIKATTSQLFGLMCYGCHAWLGRHTRVSQLKKLNAQHYRLLRIVE